MADPRTDARRHFARGMELIAEGKQLEGIEALEQAYRILPHPNVMYNIARAWLDAGYYDEAIESFRIYLESDPPDREEVLQMIRDIRARRDAALSAAAAPAPTPMPSLPSPRKRSIDQPEVSLRIQGRLDAIEDTLGTILRRLDELSGPAGRPPGPNQRVPDAGAGEEAISGAPAPDPYAAVVITSSRHDQSPLESPSAITVISGDAIRRSGARSIPEVLRRVPGVDVMAISPADRNLSIRGFNAPLANKVLVLVDGRSIYLDFIGATLWPLLSISLEDIERIEVIRGSGAALYGANAFSGVVNIITRNPGAADDRPEVRLGGGFPDQRNGVLRFSARRGATAWRASMGFDEIERWSIDVDDSRSDYVVLSPWPDDSVRVSRIDARVDHRVNRETTLSVSGGLSQGLTEFQAIGALRDFFVDGSYGYLRGDLGLPRGFALRSFWNHFDATASPWIQPVGGLDLRSHPISDVVDVELEWVHEGTWGVQQRLNAGLGYRYKGIQWEWLPEREREHHLSFFVQDEARLAPALAFTASLRLDRHPVLAAIRDAALFDRYALSPRGALIWSPKAGRSLRFTVANAFRTPTFLENYNHLDVPTSNASVLILNEGNPALLPERMLSSEIGYLHLDDSGAYEFEALAYLNRVEGLVELSEVEPWADPSTMALDDGHWYAGTTSYLNADSAYRALGLEVGARFYPVDGIDVYANYSISDIRPTTGESRDPVRTTSPHRFNAGLLAGFSGVSLGLDLHFSSAQTWELRSFDDEGQVVLTPYDLPAWVYVNARAAWTPPESRLEMAIVGRNLAAPFRAALITDERIMATPAGTHREYPLGQPIPFEVSGSLRYYF